VWCHPVTKVNQNDAETFQITTNYENEYYNPFGQNLVPPPHVRVEGLLQSLFIVANHVGDLGLHGFDV